MFYVLKYIYCLLAKAYAEYADPRSKHLPLVYSPLPVLAICSAYLAFVLYYGPKWMRNRQPFQLKFLMRIYNAVQVIANISLLIYGIRNSYAQEKFSLSCQPIDPTIREPWMINLIYATYGYYITKYLDLFDTIFIVLRKRDHQISFLHLYHHTGMVVAVYAFTTFTPGSHGTMLGVVNLFVHTVMYSYYFVTSLKQTTETVWWKRHITQLQLIQFGYLAFHFLQAIINNTCNHSVAILLIAFMQNLFMFAIFSDFYYKAYLKKPKGFTKRPNNESEHAPPTSTIEKLNSS